MFPQIERILEEVMDGKEADYRSVAGGSNNFLPMAIA
jgi:hypothetical protein